jgi:site-specific recombinase XerD
MSTGRFEELVEQYRRWLTFERCLSAGRIEAYVREARRFLRIWDGQDLKVLALDEVTSYVVQGCRRRRSGSARNLVAGLRSLLRYLHLEGSRSGNWRPPCRLLQGGVVRGCPKV